MKQKHNKHEIKWCTEVKIRTQKLDGKKKQNVIARFRSEKKQSCNEK